MRHIFGPRISQARVSIVASVLALSGALSCAATELAHGRKWVRGIYFKGNRHVSSGDLADGLWTEKTGWWPFASKKWFDSGGLDVDLERIRRYYAEQGFFEAKVVNQQILDQGDGSVEVVLTIDEGNPTSVTDIELQGLDGYPSKLREDLERKLPIERNVVFKYQAYVDTKRLLIERLRNRGYAYAETDSQVFVDDKAHRAKVQFKLQPGPLVRMGDVTIVGNKKIPKQKILNRVTFVKGETYRPQAIDTTEGRLYNLGVFSSVRATLPKEPTPDGDITLSVAPGPLHELRIGGGLGVERERQEARLRFTWAFRNFLGGLRTLTLRSKPAYVVLPDIFNRKRHGPAAENDITLIQPDIFNSKITARAVVGYDLGIQDAFQFHGPRTQLGIDRPTFHEHVLLGVSWNLQYLNFFNVDDAVFDPVTTNLGLGFKDPYRVAYLEEFATIDLRDRPLDPHLGAYFVLRVEEGFPAVGSDFTYLKFTPEARGYIPFGRRIVLAGRGLVGWLRPAGLDDSPVTRRYALGGPSSHRGFGFGRLAAQAEDPVSGDLVPVGGNGALLLSAELRLDMVKIAGNWLGLVPFVDWGDVTPHFDDLDLSNLHIATGADLTYGTPIGQIRIGMGVRLNRLDDIGPKGLPNPDPGERLAFHLTIGEAF
jgi:translocation and assembly module TamA